MDANLERVHGQNYFQRLCSLKFFSGNGMVHLLNAFGLPVR